METLKRFGTKAFILLTLVFLCHQSVAQSGDNKNPKSKSRASAVGIASVIKDTGTIEELPPPPPPTPPHAIEMKSVRIDTGSTWSPENREMQVSDLPDTTTAPADELTVELKKMLELTGALNMGMRNAELAMEALREVEDDLPEGFIDRFKIELSSDAFRKIFENTVINIYRKHLTIEDVKGLNNFYQSDLGKKTISTMPVILSESISAGQAIGAMLGEKVYEDLIKQSKKN